MEWSVGHGLDTLVVAPGQRRSCFRNRPVFLGTVEVTAGERRLVDGVDFVTDANEGCLEILSVSADTLRLVARYRYLPLSSPLRFRLHTPEALDAPAGVDSIRAGTVPREQATSLSVGGSKTFAVELGSNRDASLEQSLDLTLRGRLARDVSLEAVLSDRDSPVTPEGTSSELEELDEVLIRVSSPHGQATFGDIEVSQQAGEFARYERRLQGVDARREGERLDVGGLVASAQGVFRSIEFFGVEGKQGPYRIGDLAGGRAVTIVPGTEEVYLDGARLDRGDNRDYVIDYALGELTFNLRRAVTFDSRITVDFEEEVESYDRRFLGGRTRVSLENTFGLSLFAISESDDRTNPRGFSLDESEIALLEELGDESPGGEAFAARFVGAGNGDYDKVAADSLAREHYEWVGAGNGEYLVSFLRVGTLLGSYADSTITDGSTIYVFRGLGGGDFEPGRRLASPESHDLADVALDWRPGALAIEGELAASRHDRNTFSARDDTDNEGFAGNATASVTGPWRWADGRGGVRLSGGWRHIDEDFSAFSRVTRSFDFLDWGYETTGLEEGEDRQSIRAEVEPGEGGTATLELGRLSSGETFDADRVSARYHLARKLRTRLEWDRTWNERPREATSGRRDKELAEISYPLWRFVPTVAYRAESTTQDGDTLVSGTRFRQLSGSNDIALAGPLHLFVDYSVRRDERRAEAAFGDWARSGDTRDRGARLALSRARGVQGSVEWRRRVFETRDATASQTTNLARLGLDAEFLQNMGRSVLDYQVTTEELFPRSKRITFVGDGRGNYDSLGVYVGVGDYDVDIVQAAARELVSRLDVVLRASFLGTQAETAPRIARHVRASSFVRVENTTRAAFADLLNPFSGHFYGTGRGTVESSANVRNEATLFPSARVSPRLRWELARSFDGRFDNVTEETKQDIYAVRLRATPRPAWSVETEGSSERTENIVAGRGSQAGLVTEQFDTRRLVASSTVTVGEVWSVTLESSVASITKPDVEGREKRYEITPILQYSPRRIGRAELRVRRVEIDGRLPRSRPSFVFGLTDASGVEIASLADVRLKEYLTLAGTFRSTKPRGGKTLHEGRMELRAYF